jgi:hypothetical protein
MLVLTKGCGSSFVKQSTAVVMGPGARRDNRERVLNLRLAKTV